MQLALIIIGNICVGIGSICVGIFALAMFLTRSENKKLPATEKLTLNWKAFAWGAIGTVFLISGFCL